MKYTPHIERNPEIIRLIQGLEFKNGGEDESKEGELMINLENEGTIDLSITNKIAPLLVYKLNQPK